MSKPLDDSGNFLPVRLSRSVTGTLNALNATLDLNVSGDAMANVHLLSSAFIGTIEFQGSIDGLNFFVIPAFPFVAASAGGTILTPGQPIVQHALVAANTSTGYSLFVGQLKTLRIRVSAYTSGSLEATLLSDYNHQSSNLSMNALPATLLVTNTAAAGSAVTATIPAVAGLRHLVTSVQVLRSASVALTAGATPSLVTTTNLPGSPVLTFGADAAQQGQDKELRLDCGPTGLLSSTVNTATTIVAPAVTGVIWRINTTYRLIA